MAVSRDEILSEIRRCAAENGGVPLGRERFTAETGIKERDLIGRYWATWNEAVTAAGLEPNSMQGRRLDDDGILHHLALLTRKLRRFPTEAHLRLERRSNPEFPTSNTIRSRIGGAPQQASRTLAYAQALDDFADVYEMLAAVAPAAEPAPLPADTPVQATGVVYLIKSGRYYKIGRSNDLGRRSYEIALQLPEKAVLVHSFETDDPPGIEHYWHERFADRRQNGEWFSLTAADVAAFKRRRRFM